MKKNKTQTRNRSLMINWLRSNLYEDPLNSPYIGDVNFHYGVFECSVMLNPYLPEWSSHVPTYWDHDIVGSWLETSEAKPPSIQGFLSYCSHWGLEPTSQRFFEYANSNGLLCSQGEHENFGHLYLMDYSHEDLKPYHGDYRDIFTSPTGSIFEEGGACHSHPFTLTLSGKRGHRTVFPDLKTSFEYVHMLLEIAPLNFERDILNTTKTLYPQNKFTPENWESGVWWPLT